MTRGRVVGDGSAVQVFACPELLADASLRRPLISDLSAALWGSPVLTPAEAAAIFAESEVAAG